jgi:predicted nucleic acid-binding protein
MQHGLNGFDAAYLALALQAGDGIATLEKQVQRAAETLGLVVFS